MNGLSEGPTERLVPEPAPGSPLGRPKGVRLALTVVCLLFGLALVVQLRTESRLQPALSDNSPTDLEAIAADLYDSNTALQQEVDQLLTQRASGGAVEDAKRAAAEGELEKLREFNGLVRLNGPGVELVVDAVLRPADLEDLLNELRNAGAEAIAIDGQRVVYNTAIGAAADQPTVNGVPVSAPLRIDALGASDVLERALARKGGMLAYLKTAYPRATIELTPKSELTLPPYSGTPPIQAEK